MKSPSERIREAADTIAAGFSHEIADDLRAVADLVWRAELAQGPSLFAMYQCGKHTPPFAWRLADPATPEPCPKCEVERLTKGTA